MAKQFLVDINLNQNELQNAVIQNLATDPGSGIAGQVYFNTTINKYKYYDGTTWKELGAGNYAPLESPAFTGTPTAPTASAGTNTTQIATTEFVSNAIGDLANAMIFKGTVGANGTAGTTLPTTDVKVGDTYKIITDGTYAGQTAKVGDMFVATATTPTWAYVPSGDEEPTINKYAGVINGDGSTTSFTLTHNLNTMDIVVSVYDSSTHEDVVVDIIRTNTNSIAINFASAPDTGTNYNVVVVG